MKRLLIIILSFGITALLSAQIIHVPANQPTIQAGINAAENGDTVLVAQGIYLENINFNGKAITVSSHYLIDPDSAHIKNTIIDGSDPVLIDFASAVTFLTGEDTTSVLCGFTITRATGMYLSNLEARIGGGIVCYFATAKIIHNIITGNQVSSSNNAFGGGVACIRETGTNWIVLTDNIIRDNQSTAGSGYATGGGIEIWGNARICHNLLVNNHCYSQSGSCGGGGITHTSINNPPDVLIFENNQVMGNTLSAPGANSVAYGGGLIADHSVIQITQSHFEYNQCEASLEAGGGGIRISTANVTIHSSSFTNNGITSDTYAEGGGISLWYSDTYLNNNEINGNSASATTEAAGGGIHFYYPNTTELNGNQICENQLITNNFYDGAGVIIFFATGKSEIRNNLFSQNAGPLETQNGGVGGGLGIRFSNDNEIIVDANRFLQNTAYYGGGFYENNCYNLLVTNNLFSGNTTTRGGAMGMTHSAFRPEEMRSCREEFRPQITNNTFVSNSATNYGGAARINCANHIPVIFNCIFYQNESPDGKDIYFQGSADPFIISSSDIDTLNIIGPWSGDGNINEDPGFIPGDTLYHLSGTSPCLDMGTDSIEIDGMVYYAPLSDYDGEPRPDCISNLPDMGADEYYQIPAPVALPAVIGYDLFEASWEESNCSSGYYLDVAYDEGFNDYVSGYENLDAGNVTSWTVTDLEASEYYYRVRAYDAFTTSGHSNVVQVVGVSVEELQAAGCKLQVFPNPSFGRSKIKYQIAEIKDQLAVGSWQLAKSAKVRITLHEISGRQVLTLLNEAQQPGEHSLYFDTSGLPAGIYLIRLQVGEAVATQKLVVLSH